MFYVLRSTFYVNKFLVRVPDYTRQSGVIDRYLYQEIVLCNCSKVAIPAKGIYQVF